MAMQIIDEANRCLNCKRPLCCKGCPVHTSIPQVIQKFKQRDLVAAGQMLFDNNPMSVICSYVCNHSQQCEGYCIRGKKGTSIHFSAIEQYVSDTYLDRFIRDVKPTHNGKVVAVVGSGPAGLTVAIQLARVGCDVTIFEQKMDIGGVLRYGILEFRLPHQLLARYRKALEALGVHVRPNTTIGGALKLDGLLRDGYDAVFVGTGAWRARTLGIKGQARGNVYFGIDYLINPSVCNLGSDVAIIGVGNVAMDVARTAIRKGSRHVTLYSNWGGTSANTDEVELAQLDGAKIIYWKSIESIDDGGPVFRNSILDDEGQVVGLSDETEHVNCDSVIICVSQVPKDKLLLTTKGLAATDRGTLVVDENCMCTVPGVFAAGDVVSGPKTVAHAVAGAKHAVAGMMDYLGLQRADDEVE
jgi:glutamate synthase (NADPH/NADH) small chain